MGSVNRVFLVGNLGRDAEMRYTPGGQAVATLNLATTETWKDKQGEKKEATEWHRIVVWGKTAEALNEYLVKGKQIVVEGKLQTRQWDDKDGNKRYTTEIRADRITLLGGGGQGQGGGTRRERPARGGGNEMENELPADPNDDPGGQIDDGDDIPFAWLLPFLLAVGASVLSGGAAWM